MADGGWFLPQGIPVIRVDLDGDELQLRVVLGHDQEHLPGDLPHPKMPGERVAAGRAWQVIGDLGRDLLDFWSAEAHCRAAFSKVSICSSSQRMRCRQIKCLRSFDPPYRTIPTRRDVADVEQRDRKSTRLNSSH